MYLNKTLIPHLQNRNTFKTNCKMLRKNGPGIDK